MLVSSSSTLSGLNVSQKATLVLNQFSASHYFRQSPTHSCAMLSISNQIAATCLLPAAVGIISAFKVSDCFPVLQLSLPVHSPCPLFFLFVPSARAELAPAAGPAALLQLGLPPSSHRAPGAHPTHTAPQSLSSASVQTSPVTHWYLWTESALKYPKQPQVIGFYFIIYFFLQSQQPQSLKTMQTFIISGFTIYQSAIDASSPKTQGPEVDRDRQERGC